MCFRESSYTGRRIAHHGTGNRVLVFSGTNFLPGVAVPLKGTYRTTTLVDPTHILADIPAADLHLTWGSLRVATNSGSASSTAVTVTTN